MKKIFQIILIALIPLVLVIGGLYLVGNIKKDNIVKDAINSIEDPYYQELAGQCGQVDSSMFKCCLASVYDMEEVEARLITDPACANLVSEQLRCPGSYEWCVPKANVTSPQDEIQQLNCLDSPCPVGYICNVSQASAMMPDGTFAVGEQTGDLLCHKECKTDDECQQEQKCQEIDLVAGDTVEVVNMCL
jgi:hypothetical protein